VVCVRNTMSKPAGTISYRRAHGYKEKWAFEKLENGKWRMLPIDDPRNSHMLRNERSTTPVMRAARVAQQRVKKTAKATRKEAVRCAKRMPRRPAACLPTRVEDLSKKVRVYVPELKAHIWHDPQKSSAAVATRYIDQHRYELMGR
jgi:hypothetical protein